MDNQNSNPTEYIQQAPVCDVTTGVCLPDGETVAAPAGKFTLPVPAGNDSHLESPE